MWRSSVGLIRIDGDPDDLDQAATAEEWEVTTDLTYARKSPECAPGTDMVPTWTKRRASREPGFSYT
jgi:hypothetical protein